MHVTEMALWLVGLVVAILLATAAARRLDLPAPILLVLTGVVASAVPWVPQVHLSADVVLVALLPPLLYTAALQTSLIDFAAQRRAILSLSVGLVAFTTVGVGLVAFAALPGLTWPAAFAIGAVVAPPDAVAATAVARRIGLPRRIVTLLEGESLLNDATALVALGAAIGAASGVVTVWGIGLDFAWTVAAGVAVGGAAARVVGVVRRKVTDAVVDTSLSMVTPFVAYVLAEELHTSGVLAVVVAGLLLGHRAALLQTASSRISERLNWRTVSYLLENSVFLLIGLQTAWILRGVAESDLSAARIAGVCAAVLAAVIALRMAWVFPARYLSVDPESGPDRRRAGGRDTLVVGWAGMRGVVTLAAAFAIPEEFPHREVLLLVALTVVAGTLLVQGLSLPWLVRRLGVPPPDPRADALVRAELLGQASRAGLARLEEIEAEDDEQDSQVRTVIRTRIEQRDFAAWERLGSSQVVGETPSERYSRLRLEMLAAERERVLQIRDKGVVPHDIVEDVLVTLDVEESMLDVKRGRAERLTEGEAVVDPRRRPPECEHLQSAGPTPEPRVRECEDCVVEGTTWVHLRQCLACGRVGCCDSSPRRHATAHFHRTGHPVIGSAEVGERWRWCYLDERLG